jgi:hypothetical protein
MATTYTWEVVQMDAYPEYGGEAEVVFNVHWVLTGSEAGFVGAAYGAQFVTLDSDANFTPYANLTQEQVIGWVKADMGADRVAAAEASVANQINDQLAPTVVAPPLPWAVAP